MSPWVHRWLGKQCCCDPYSGRDLFLPLFPFPWEETKGVNNWQAVFQHCNCYPQPSCYDIDSAARSVVTNTSCSFLQNKIICLEFPEVSYLLCSYFYLGTFLYPLLAVVLITDTIAYKSICTLFVQVQRKHSVLTGGLKLSFILDRWKLWGKTYWKPFSPFTAPGM